MQAQGVAWVDGAALSIAKSQPGSSLAGEPSHAVSDVCIESIRIFRSIHSRNRHTKRMTLALSAHVNTYHLVSSFRRAVEGGAFLVPDPLQSSGRVSNAIQSFLLFRSDSMHHSLTIVVAAGSSSTTTQPQPQPQP